MIDNFVLSTTINLLADVIENLSSIKDTSFKDLQAIRKVDTALLHLRVIKEELIKENNN